MKKFAFVVLASCLFLTGCEGDNIFSNDSKDDYSTYEYHYYDEDFKHTEDFIVKYDKNGNFKELKTIVLYDKDDRSCPNKDYTVEDYPDLAYKDVSIKCTKDTNGVTYTASMTDESVKAGYLKNDDDDCILPLKYYYDDLSTEDKAETVFKKFVEEFKNNNIEKNSRNYIIIKGEEVNW